MEIKIIGNESSNRMKLLKNVGKALEKVKGKISVSLLEDEGDRVKYNVSNVPALIINDKVISQGKILNEKEIVNFIRILALKENYFFFYDIINLMLL